MLAYLFPGQGSQVRGMGGDLFDEFPDHVALADDILGYSIKKLCLQDPDQQLNQTQYTQPALYVVNALSYFKQLKMDGPRPDFVCGHSLGEYNALLAAKVFDFGTGLKLVKMRGELMSRVRDGGMTAVLGLTITEIQNLLHQHGLHSIFIANYNTHTQIVISGPQKDLNHACSIFRENTSASCIPLKVSGAFHSPYMSEAQQQFSEFLEEFQFHVPAVPVIANLNASPYHPAVIRTNLSAQITHTVKWTSIIDYLLTHKGITLKEIGPGQVLSGLLASIKAARISRESIKSASV
ncbi:Polyketide biosynthesis malonyl CoA-acyl carrier protein transacylase PksC [Aquicella siphonis]|uniref:Malonyl CoA-acyl carrier protein transacylase n=1 Tax=Aquicella siphonis TaxID=254247 RepID=A0A5E4PKU2_9COXI|nr:ACP S-malonyltransferase [Aquicella siphonis]VVC77178.1 Polyketide biosynthesis malonyl CoA-acyl carrier protein transacylase PksC [Aquicella siphonis]